MFFRAFRQFQGVLTWRTNPYFMDIICAKPIGYNIDATYLAQAERRILGATAGLFSTNTLTEHRSRDTARSTKSEVFSDRVG